MSLSTHVLDASSGRPAAGVLVELHAVADHRLLESTSTDTDGRIADLGVPGAGVYELTFASGDYFATRGVATFYPQVNVRFEIIDPDAHYHVPLLLSPFAYSTYRGS